jgi:hypothetical protein
MIRNVRNILKLNTRICKRFSTNSEHEKWLLCIKDDLLKNHIEINNIKNNHNCMKEIIENRSLFNITIYSISGIVTGYLFGSTYQSVIHNRFR